MDGWIHWMNGWMEKEAWVGERVDGRVGGWFVLRMDGWVSRCISHR